MKLISEEDVIKHWGIPGQKWGVRRWQYPDGRFTEEGKERYFGQNADINDMNEYLTNRGKVFRYFVEPMANSNTEPSSTDHIYKIKEYNKEMWNDENGIPDMTFLDVDGEIGYWQYSKKSDKLGKDIVDAFKYEFIKDFSPDKISKGKQMYDYIKEELIDTNRILNFSYRPFELTNKLQAYKMLIKKDKQYNKNLSDYKKGKLSMKYDDYYDKLTSIFRERPNTSTQTYYKMYGPKYEEFGNIVNNKKTSLKDIDKFINKYYKD